MDEEGDRIIERSKGVCENCGDTLPLEVHHSYYRWGRYPWQIQTPPLWPCVENAINKEPT